MKNKTIAEAIAKSRAQKIAEARRVGAPRWSSEAEGRANQMKFDIFRKPPASKEKKRKNFKELFINLKWRIRWTQPDCSNCPNTPLKIAIGKVESTYTITTLSGQNQEKLIE